MDGSKLLSGVAALLIAIGLGACGDGGGNTTGSASSSAGTTSPSSGEEHRGGEASIEEFGSEAEGSDREQLLAAFTSYMNAIADKDYGAACFHLSATAQGGLEQFAGKAAAGSRGCTVLLPKLLSPPASAVAREQANGKIVKVRVEGDRAFIVFKAPGAKLYQLTMVREDGEWKAATVVSSVLVPDLSGVTP